MASAALRIAIIGVVALGGCNPPTRTAFPVNLDRMRDEALASDQKVTAVVLSAANIERYSTPRDRGRTGTSLPGRADWTYRVGVGDVLDVVVWDHPELTSPAGENRTPEQGGLRVQSDGSFFYPYIGHVEAEGKTPEEIREQLAKDLAKFIPDPQIVVRVVRYASQAVSVTGEVKGASRQYIGEEPLTLLDAIDASGGLTENADAARVTVRRNGTIYTVNMDDFLKRGDGRSNPMMMAGDVVSVPKRTVQEAYLLGQVIEPSTIDLAVDDVTLTQALTSVGGLVEDRADARGVFVFRNSPNGVMVFQLDVHNPVAFLLGTRFMLMPQDVVYVTTAPVNRWNEVVTAVLPTLALSSNSVGIARQASDL